MTPKEIELIQSSWKKLTPIADTAAQLFYEKLFALDPAVKSLFKSDLRDQGRRLMSMITSAVNGLSNVPALVPVVQELGRRHGKYGVTPAHYETVGTALLWTLQQGLGDGFTPDVKTAWTSVYGVLAKTMKDAAAS